MTFHLRARAQLLDAIQLWNRHGCVDLSAAFAFHSLQSFFPFLLVCLGVAAQLFGQSDGATERIVANAAAFLPPGGQDVVAGVLERLIREGQRAEQVGVVVLIFSASNATLSLQRGSDRLWYGFQLPSVGVRSWHWHLRRWLLQRLKAIGAALLLTLVLLINQITTPFRQLWALITQSLVDLPLDLPEPWEVPARTAASVLGSWLGVLIAVVLLFLYLPTRRPPLRLIWPGALLVATGLTFINPVLGSLLVWVGSRFLAYGLVGGVILLTLWIWLLGLILYFGMAWTVALHLRRRNDVLVIPESNSGLTSQ